MVSAQPTFQDRRRAFHFQGYPFCRIGRLQRYQRILYERRPAVHPVVWWRVTSMVARTIFTIGCLGGFCCFY